MRLSGTGLGGSGRTTGSGKNKLKEMGLINENTKQEHLGDDAGDDGNDGGDREGKPQNA